MKYSIIYIVVWALLMFLYGALGFGMMIAIAMS